MENQNNIVFEPEKPRINNPSNNIVLVETSFTKGYEKKIETWSLQELISEYSKVSALNCEKIETKTNLSGTLNKIKQQVLAKIWKDIPWVRLIQLLNLKMELYL